MALAEYLFLVACPVIAFVCLIWLIHGINKSYHSQTIKELEQIKREIQEIQSDIQNEIRQHTNKE